MLLRWFSRYSRASSESACFPCEIAHSGIGSRYQNKVIFALDEGSQETRYGRGFEEKEQMFARLIANWVYGGFLAGLLLLLLTPVLVHSWPACPLICFISTRSTTRTDFAYS
jgi:hypothetical protein